MPRGSRLLAEPVLYRHPDTGAQRTAVTKVDVVSYEADGFRRAAVLDGEVDADDTEHLEAFDPSARTVAEVNAYLATADEAERTRVLEAEAAGRNRATVRIPESPEPVSGSAE